MHAQAVQLNHQLMGHTANSRIDTRLERARVAVTVACVTTNEPIRTPQKMGCSLVVV